MCTFYSPVDKNIVGLSKVMMRERKASVVIEQWNQRIMDVFSYGATLACPLLFM
jgi:hypothetical protein